MLTRIAEVSSPAFLCVEGRQLVVRLQSLRGHYENRNEVAPGLREAARGSSHPRVPLEDLGILILDGPGISLTKELLSECAERNIAVVVCDARHMPASQLVPFSSHTLTGRVFREQLGMSQALKKQVWKQIVQAKLLEQARALETVEAESAPNPDAQGNRRTRPAAAILSLASAVTSGDRTNLEGRAATIYFDALFGPEFLRDRSEPGLNAMLNYGYAVIRACTARALVGTGLHLGLSVFHSNQYNAYGLVDDAMEPLRPLVDIHVRRMSNEVGVPECLAPPIKRRLLEILEAEVWFEGRKLPLLVALGYYASSIKQVLCGGERKVAFPSQVRQTSTPKRLQPNRKPAGRPKSEGELPTIRRMNVRREEPH